MSTLTASAASASPGRPGFAAAIRGELLLTRRRLAAWVSLAIWALCIAVFAYLVSYVSTVGAEWYSPEQQRMFVSAMLPSGTSYYVLASLPLYGAPQFAILGAILGSSDYTRGTIRTITSRFPNRTPFIAARLANLVILSAAAATVTLLTSIFSSSGIAMVAGRETKFPSLIDLATTGLAIWLVAIAFIAIGFALGSLTRSILAAVAIAVGWVLGVESLLVGMLAPFAPALEAVQGFLPVGATSSLAAGFIPSGQQTVPAIIATTTPGSAVVVLLVWTALACTVSFILFRRRDLA